MKARVAALLAAVGVLLGVLLGAAPAANAGYKLCVQVFYKTACVPLP